MKLKRNYRLYVSGFVGWFLLMANTAVFAPPTAHAAPTATVSVTTPVSMLFEDFKGGVFPPIRHRLY